MTGNGWDQMSLDAKTLDFARGCNSIQNQLVNFSRFSSFGTVRSEVRILSPRPVFLSKTPLALSGFLIRAANSAVCDHSTNISQR